MKACASCGVSLAEDQRYCLECGSRQPQARSQFLDRFTPAAVGPQAPGGEVVARARSSSVTAVAGVGVLLLAMGVGVLIGRAGNGGAKTPTVPAQVISVASPGAAAPSEGAAAPTSTSSTPPSSGTGGGAHSGAKTGTGGSSSSSKSTTTGSSTDASKRGASGSTGKSAAPKSSPSKSTESAEQKARNIPNVVTTG